MLRVDNPTAEPLAAYAVTAPDAAPVELARIEAGTVADLPVAPGWQIAFAGAEGWVGASYVVGEATNQAVSLPIPPAAATAPPRIGDGSALVRFENPSGMRLQIHHVLPDGSAAPFVAAVDAGFFVDVAAEAGALIGISDGSAWIGDPYRVTGRPPEVVTIPVAAAPPAGTGPPAAAAPRIGDGSAMVRFENPTAMRLQIHHVLPDGSAAPFVAQLEAGFAIDVAAEAGALIGISDGSAWIGDPYRVTGRPPEVVALPVARSGEDLGQNAAAVRIGDGSAVVRLENPSARKLFVHHILDDGSDAPLVAEIDAGFFLDLPAQAGAILGISDGVDWIGGQHVVTGVAPEILSLPLPAAAAGTLPGRVGDGSVTLRLANPTDQPLGVHVVPEDGAETQLVAAIDPGATIDLPAQAGFRIGFSPGTDWFGGIYMVTPEPFQQPVLPLPRSFLAGAGSAPVAVTNGFGQELGIFLLSGDESEPLGSVGPGETVVLMADPGMRFGFSPGGDFLGGNLVVAGLPGEAVTLPLPLRTGTGSVTVRVVNRSGRALAVVDVPAGADGVAGNLGILPDGGTVDVLADPGVRLGFADDQGYAGGHHLVGPDPMQQIAAPLPLTTGDRSVATRLTNTGGQALGISVVDGASAEMIGSIRAGETVDLLSGPCTMLGFSSMETFEWVGGMVQVSRDLRQQVDVPRPDDSDPGKCLLLTDAQLQLVLARLAADQVRLAEEDKAKTRFCWKDTYGRGVGTIPRLCPAGQTESTAGLCYDDCRAGFQPFVTMCVPTCPAGFTDTGLHCLKPAPYERSAFVWKLGDTPFSLDDARARCRSSAEGRRYGCGTYNSNTIVYSECRPGYRTAPVATSLCTPVCPAGTIDIGFSCQKTTYDRGVGKPMQCGPGKDRDAGLCYDRCQPGYAGVGPVCWNQCPAKLPVNCGAGCAANQAECALNVTDQVIGPLMTAASVTLIAVTAGGATGATAAANAARAAASTAGKTAGQIAARSAGRAAAEATLKQQVMAALTRASTNAVARAVATDLAIDVAVSAVLSGSIYGAMSAEAKDAMRGQVRDAFDAGYATGGEIDPRVVDAAVAAALEGAEQSDPAADFPWESLDPTGVAEIVRAYNHPICADVR